MCIRDSGIAPKQVLTKDIYLGAIPWLCLQLLLVAIVIAWPESVTWFLDRGPVVDPASVVIDMPPPVIQDPAAVPFFQ